MKRILVVCPPNKIFGRFAEACVDSLDNLGYEVVLQKEYSADFDIALFFDFYAEHNIVDDTYKVGYNFEPLWVGRWRRQISQKQHQYDCIFDASYLNCSYSKICKPHIFCPIGYHPMFECLETVEKKEKIIFIGDLSKYRQKIIQRISTKTAKTVKVITGKYWQELEKDSSGIYLNIHGHRSKFIFEGARIIGVLMSNKCFVISETCKWSPLKNGIHYVEAHWSSMPEKVQYYLNNPLKREKIAQQGYDFIKTQYRFQDHIKRAMEQICQK